jgi:hypothetical protein
LRERERERERKPLKSDSAGGRRRRHV